MPYNTIESGALSLQELRNDCAIKQIREFTLF